MFKTKNKIALFLCMIFALSMLFGGCSIKEDSEISRQLCEDMVDHIIHDDYESAYAMVRAVASENEFQPLWNTMRDVLKDSVSYELQQKNWYQNWSNGITTTQVLFEITTDDGKICQMLIYTRDGIEGIAGLNFLDSTAFVQKTESLNIVNIFLIVLSIGCFAFSIWMFIDCLKRCKKHKALWALLTLCCAGFSLTTGPSTFKFYFRVSLLAGLTNVTADRTALTIALNVLLPLGAIIYCIMRKRLARPTEECAVNPTEENVTIERSEET